MSTILKRFVQKSMRLNIELAYSSKPLVKFVHIFPVGRSVDIEIVAFPVVVGALCI